MSLSPFPRCCSSFVLVKTSFAFSRAVLHAYSSGFSPSLEKFSSNVEETTSNLDAQVFQDFLSSRALRCENYSPLCGRVEGVYVLQNHVARRRRRRRRRRRKIKVVQFLERKMSLTSKNAHTTKFLLILREGALLLLLLLSFINI